MGFNIVYLDSTGHQASKIERKTTVISIEPPLMQVGSTVTLSVEVENTGPDDCLFCTVAFFYERSGDPAPALIDPNSCRPSNPPPPAGLNGDGEDNTAIFSVDWTIQEGFDGTGIVYAQIQTQNPPPYVDPTNMNLQCNAERNVAILPLTGVVRAATVQRKRKEGARGYAE